MLGRTLKTYREQRDLETRLYIYIYTKTSRSIVNLRQRALPVIRKYILEARLRRRDNIARALTAIRSFVLSKAHSKASAYNI